ncbi:DUF7508 domain-containing protein [Halobellus captivus]|uniref:DUF7508 domain-containing protein n=1 Tax=Halobellus captivus TaxID=2592614 RepID=UPI0011A2C758|nr:hypothetical protein [Halobellus captivus]
MALRKGWEPLTRKTVGSAPEAYGIVEFGDGSGTVVEAAAGFLPDELREELAYGDAEQVRWQRAQSLEHAETLLDER